jgi:hypothetical protein
VAYLQCPECRLTVPAAAYYLRGDECPRCLTAMAPVPPRSSTPRPAPEPQPEQPAVAGD